MNHIIMNKVLKLKSAIVILFLVLCVPSVLAVESDFGGMFNITFRKKICKPLDFQLQQNLWVNRDFTRYERYMPIVGLDYAVWRNYLKANLLYFYLNQQMSDYEIKNRHRYQVGLTGAYAFKHISLSLCTRFESTYTVGVENPSNKWRNRLQLNFIISEQSKWKPFINADFFHFLNNPKGNDLERIWYDLGVEYQVDKNNCIELKVREEQMLTTCPKQLNTMFGISYKVRI